MKFWGGPAERIRGWG